MPHAYTEDQLVDQPTIGLFAELECFLWQVEKIATPAEEPTIFAMGGRGYYENPASDLLAFFLKPAAAHGLGDLFLSTFLECIEADYRQLGLNHVDIQWGKSNLALWREEKNFMVIAFLVGLDEGQKTSAFDFFLGMKHWTEGDWLAWYPQPGFQTRATAIAEVIRFSKFLTHLFRTSPEPVLPPVEMK